MKLKGNIRGHLLKTYFFVTIPFVGASYQTASAIQYAL
jgi:hypothetical protein